MIEYREQFFESPAEREAIHFLSKLLGCELVEQFWVRTKGNKFYRLDFVLIEDSERIAVEIDGKLWHNKEKDIDRDRAILESGYIDNIIRFSALNAKMYPEVIAYYLRKLYPNFFDKVYGCEERIEQHLRYNEITIQDQNINKHNEGILIDVTIKIGNSEEKKYSVQDGLDPEEADELTSEYKTFKIIKRKGDLSNSKVFFYKIVKESFPDLED